MYNEGARRLQERFDTRRLADRLEDRKVTATIGARDRELIERLDMFFIATADADGRPQCSYKGGDPGLVRVLDERTLAFPNYDGNGMYLTMGNLLVNPEVGLLFIDFTAERPTRLRVNGTAELVDDPEVTRRWAGAQFAVRVAVREVFPNCPRYIHRMELAERSRFVPRTGEATPVPDWKRADWAIDVLPADEDLVPRPPGE